MLPVRHVHLGWTIDCGHGIITCKLQLRGTSYVFGEIYSYSYFFIWLFYLHLAPCFVFGWISLNFGWISLYLAKFLCILVYFNIVWPANFHGRRLALCSEQRWWWRQPKPVGFDFSSILCLISCVFCVWFLVYFVFDFLRILCMISCVFCYACD